MYTERQHERIVLHYHLTSLLQFDLPRSPGWQYWSLLKTMTSCWCRVVCRTTARGSHCCEPMIRGGVSRNSHLMANIPYVYVNFDLTCSDYLHCTIIIVAIVTSNQNAYIIILREVNDFKISLKYIIQVLLGTRCVNYGGDVLDR